ncbi:hypothetical protein TWF694_010007 [Orbilia ellipsospora]|uniref:Uncharacterized protein n=1 Tax=Orbilia ellipsospora TaxID=2528407 RepID=A0AAV9X9T8_9PEZI
MATTAITAIVNPITALKGGKTRIAIYSQFANNTLGFEQRFLGDITNKTQVSIRKTRKSLEGSVFSIQYMKRRIPLSKVVLSQDVATVNPRDGSLSNVS